MKGTPSFIMQGGLDLVTPELAMPSGHLIAAVNYESNDNGYSRVEGFTRFDGRVPGEVLFWYLPFDAGSTALTAGQLVRGVISGATGILIEDAVVTSGSYGGGDAAGYFLLQTVFGNFQDNESLRLGALNATNTKIYLAMNGVDASTTFTDSNIGGAAHTWSAAGNAQIDTAQSISGGASGIFDGTGDFISTADHADFNLGSAEFEVDCWVKLSSDGDLRYICGQNADPTDVTTSSLRLYRAVGNQIAFTVSDGAAYTTIASTTLVTIAKGWTHVVAGRQGNTTYLCIDGVQENSASFSGSIPNATDVFGVAAAGALTVNTFNGWIDEFAMLTGTTVATVDGAVLQNTTPSGDLDDATQRSLVMPPPGIGPTRGVVTYNGHVYAIRDKVAGGAGLYKATGAGWTEVVFTCKLMNFDGGSSEVTEGETITGGTSGATATIKRYVQVAGDWGAGDNASGYLVIEPVSGGPFQDNEAVTGGGGSAFVADGVPATLSIDSGGKYDFAIHNFYGEGKNVRLYWANGETWAYEFDDIESFLAPIKTGQFVPVVSDVVEDDNDFVVEDDADNVVITAAIDKPSFIAHFVNHLFLGYSDGSVVHSGVGEPLQYRTADGAGSFAFGSSVSGMLSSLTSLTITGNEGIQYLTGQDADTFNLQPITDTAGAVSYTLQLIGGPAYLDDAGVRRLSTSAAFGDWKLGTLTGLVWPMFKMFRDRDAHAACSMRVNAKDHYRLYLEDGTGVTVYIGRKAPEAIPFRLPIRPFCAYQGELVDGDGDRLFIGADDGYVYEMDRGRSFDGVSIEAYARVAFNAMRSPMQNKRFHHVTVEMDVPEAIEIGIAYDVNYARGIGGTDTQAALAGTPTISTDPYANVSWTTPVSGILDFDVEAEPGRNLAFTLITNDVDKPSHTLQAATVQYSPLGLAKHG